MSWIWDVFFAHLIRPTTRYRPDIEALRAASTRIVVAVGATSKGQLANGSAVALARQLSGCDPPSTASPRCRRATSGPSAESDTGLPRR